MPKGIPSGGNSRFRWTEARCLYLISAVIMVKGTLWRTGKRYTYTWSEMWKNVAAQLPIHAFGNIHEDRLSKVSEKQFAELLSRHNGTLAKSVKKPLSVNISVKLQKYNHFFARARDSQIVKTRAYIGSSEDSQGQSKVPEVELATSKKAQRFSNEEPGFDVDPIIGTSETEDLESSRANKDPSIEDLPIESEPGCYDNGQSIYATSLNSRQNAVHGSISSYGKKADDSRPSSRNTTRNIGWTTRSTTEGFEYKDINHKEKLLEIVDEELSQLTLWCEQRLLPVGKKFFSKAADAGLYDETRKRSTPHQDLFEELVTDSSLLRLKSKLGFQFQDLRLEFTKHFYRTIEEVFRDFLEAQEL